MQLAINLDEVAPVLKLSECLDSMRSSQEPVEVELVNSGICDHETESGAVRVKVLDIVGGCGSRENGREVRTVVENLVEADKRKVVIDFEGAETCSSAFVDELVGKLLEKYGFSSFAQAISIANVHGVVALLLNHSVRQRLIGEQPFVQEGE